MTARLHRPFFSNRNIRIALTLFNYDDVVANKYREIRAAVSHGDAA
jgi:hypothetical protein